MPNYNKRERDKSGKYLPVTKGAVDSSFGYQASQNATAPKAVQNFSKSLTPVEAYELSSAVRSAIRARNEPIRQIEIRLFTKDGREITSGEVYRFWCHPNPFQSVQEFIQAISMWNDMSGERMAYMHQDKDTGDLVSHVLNPMACRTIVPIRPVLPEHIQTWQYIWDQGVIEMIPADAMVYEHDYNPSSLVRGISPLIAVVNSITASYSAQRYIRSYFQNNARPSSIVNVETDNPDLVEPFKKEFLSVLQGDVGAWKTFFTAGQKVSITALDQPISEAPFQQLILNVRDEVAALYMVPPLHGGMWDKTRFDSVEEQNTFFYQSVFLPRLAQLQYFCQKLTDKHLRYSSINTRQITMSKSMRTRFEKALGSTNTDKVVVLDADPIPAVAMLKKIKIEYAQELMNTFKITPRAAATEVGMELELNPSADLTWYPTSEKFVEDLKAGGSVITPDQVAIEGVDTVNRNMQDAVTEEQEITSEGNVDVEEDKPSNPQETKKYLKLFRELRHLTLNKADEGNIWTLSEADTLLGPQFKETIRKLYFELKVFCRNRDKENIRKVMNIFSRPSVIKNTLKGKDAK